MLRVHFGTPALMRLQDEGLNFAPNCYWGVCRAQFSCLEELMEHVEERHLDPLKNYEFPSGIQCKWLNCAKTVKDWRTLTYHVQAAHTGTEWAVAMLRLLQGKIF